MTVKILSGGAMRSLMTDAIPLFERANGIKVTIEFRLTSVLKKEIEDGGAFDIALLPRPELDALVAAGKIAADVVDVARSTVGLAVRAGAPKPDIETVATFKRALIEARSIAYSDGPSGAYVGGLLERLGIAEAVESKTLLTSRPVAELVASGDAELGLQQIVAILPVEGAELVGPLPSELQNTIIYAAGISSSTRQRAACVSLVAFMATETARGLMPSKGLDPAGPDPSGPVIAHT